MAYPVYIWSGDPIYAIEPVSYAAQAWPATDLIIYVPIRMPDAFTVKRVWWANATTSGNANFGFYSAAGSKLWETGSTARAGTNQLQFVNIADQSHVAGLYYMALQQSNTSGGFNRSAVPSYSLAASGVLEEAAGSFALPATATFTTMTRSFLPAYGLDLRG